jgi:beta-lactamase regulating signal transducer with metallopeptidase domain
MFAVRGMVISLAVFATVYCLISLTVHFTWRRLGSYFRPSSARWQAELFFALRMLPLFSAALLTAAFAIPSFVMFEPRSIEEPLSSVPVIMALMGLTLLLVGFAKSLAALCRASRMISKWTREASTVEVETPVSVLHVSGDVPPMTATGIVRPRVLLSDAAASALSASELHAALNHELAHVHRRDNFRKLLLQFVAFPGMSSLEFAWLEATEMAADDAAVSNAAEALDLASALIKLSRFSSLNPPVELTAALVHSPASLVDARVKRLIGWTQGPHAKRGHVTAYGMGMGIVALSLFFFYGQLLVQVHAATEWLMR